MSESTPEPIDLGEPERFPVIAAPYRVTNNAIGQPTGQYFEMVTRNGNEPERVLFKFESVRTKESVGVELWPDGTIHVGAWNAEGEWIELRLVDDSNGQASVFDLAQYGNALDESIVPS